MNLCAATDCGHGQIAHRYLHGSGAATGECLCPGCPCGDFEEAPIALNARENEGEMCENGDSKNEPQPRTWRSAAGAQPTSKESTRA